MNGLFASARHESSRRFSRRANSSQRASSRAQPARNAFRVIVDAIRNRQHGHLHWREPERKRARVVFNQNAEEAFD